MQAQAVSRHAQLRRASIAGAQSHCSFLGPKAELRLTYLPPPYSLVHWGRCRADYGVHTLCLVLLANQKTLLSTVLP